MERKQSGKAWKSAALGMAAALAAYLLGAMGVTKLILSDALEEGAARPALWICAAMGAALGALVCRLRRQRQAGGYAGAGFFAVILLCALTCGEADGGALARFAAAAALGTACAVMPRAGKRRRRRHRKVT